MRYLYATLLTAGILSGCAQEPKQVNLPILPIKVEQKVEASEYLKLIKAERTLKDESNFNTITYGDGKSLVLKQLDLKKYRAYDASGKEIKACVGLEAITMENCIVNGSRIQTPERYILQQSRPTTFGLYDEETPLTPALYKDLKLQTYEIEINGKPLEIYATNFATKDPNSLPVLLLGIPDTLSLIKTPDKEDQWGITPKIVLKPVKAVISQIPVNTKNGEAELHPTAQRLAHDK